MHLSEGLLPLPWVAGTTAVAVPLVAVGARQIAAKAKREPTFRPLLGLAGAAVFAISALPIPVPIAGTCAHPTGVGIACILLGGLPSVAVVAVVLAIQALLMAHGGITTWGANTLNMGVLGVLAAFAAFWLLRRSGVPLWIGALAAGFVGDLATYAGTAGVMGLALHGDRSAATVTGTIFAAFLPTQIPLAVFEAILTAAVVQFILTRRPDIAARRPLLRQRKPGQKEASHAL